MKKTLIVILSLILSTVLCANVTLFVKSDCSVNGTWYNCYPDEEFYGNLGTISTLTLNYKMEVQFETSGVIEASISIEVDDLWQAAYMTKDSTVGNTEYWSTGDVTIDISSIPVEGHHEVRFSCGYKDGSGWLFDPEMMYYVQSFSKAEVPAPITLKSFTAEVFQGKVELNWVTESETENSHFLVYCDGEVIAQVEGNGTTTEQHSYSFLDTQVRAGNHSYAIADVSYGGVEELHEALEVEVGAALAEADFVLNKAYPNPFNPRVALSMELSFAQGYGESGYGAGGNVVLNIYNAQGVLVDELINGFVEAGHHNVTWDASNMPSGVYIVKMIVGDMMQSQKIVLMK